MIRAFRHIKSTYAEKSSFDTYYSEMVFNMLHEANIDTNSFEVVVPLKVLKKIVLKMRNSVLASKYDNEIERIEEDIRWAMDNKSPDVTYHMFKRKL